VVTTSAGQPTRVRPLRLGSGLVEATEATFLALHWPIETSLAIA
jgi:hypothetical protein